MERAGKHRAETSSLVQLDTTVAAAHALQGDTVFQEKLAGLEAIPMEDENARLAYVEEKVSEHQGSVRDPGNSCSLSNTVPITGDTGFP
jgi:hypothetical protein